jgi:hypothetical protein
MPTTYAALAYQLHFQRLVASFGTPKGIVAMQMSSPCLLILTFSVSLTCCAQSQRNPDILPDAIQPKARAVTETPSANYGLKSIGTDQKPKPVSRASRTSFFILSGLVYSAAAMDMHETRDLTDACQKVPLYCKGSFQEADPFSRPFVHLPAPAYYATGFALATGVNWLGWKMAKSRRWHKVSWLPQVISIGGNSWGISTDHR